MGPMTSRQIEDYVKSLGCVKSHGVGSHRGWINPATGGYTVIPFHGNKNLPQGTLLAICRQLGIEKPKR